MEMRRKISFQITASMKMTVFWKVRPCSLVKPANFSNVLTASIIRAVRASNLTQQIYFKQQIKMGRNKDIDQVY
jgi:hypothetical protein